MQLDTRVASKPSLDLAKVLKLLEQGGPLSLCLKGYETRDQQKNMLTNVLDAYNFNKIALIEAATGTGKSLAYLIPAILWAVTNKQRTVISTHTINLQEQLVHKDIPALTAALGVECKAVLVKGMNNFVCLRKLDDVQEEIPLLSSEESGALQKIQSWSRTTQEGSFSDLPIVPGSSTWERVRAEADACNSNECPYFHKCFFFKARKEASDAHLLIANHHLLFADLACRMESEKYEETAILPPYQRLIIDEAHHIEDVATEFFASDTSRVEIMRTLAKLASEKHSNMNGKIPLLKKKIHEFIGHESSKEAVSIVGQLSVELPALRRDIIQYLGDGFQTLSAYMSQMNRSEDKLRMRDIEYKDIYWKEEVHPRMEKLIASIRSYLNSIGSLQRIIESLKNEKLLESTKSIRLDITALVNRLDSSCTVIESFLDNQPTASRVRWLHTQQVNTLQNVHLIDAELDISHHLAKSLFSKFATVVLCSATMTTNHSFDFIRRRLGLHHEELRNRTMTENIYESPFNYSKQAVLAIPLDMPEPTHSNFIQEAIEKIWIFLQASRGNAFVLFTSYAMLKSCYNQLYERMLKSAFVPFKQGDCHRQTLIKNFRKTDRAVLFGTDSFWEGVDVAGDALRCVIIVKLPFKVPSEPLYQARSEDLVAQGKDPFMDYAIPLAIVKLKQGCGRLIRNQSDRGCVVCLDSRLLTKSYGKLFLNSLPSYQYLFAPSNQIQQQMTQFFKPGNGSSR